MVEVAVGFKQTQDIIDFVRKVNQFSCNADLVSGNRAVDAKSLMGALAISQAADFEAGHLRNSQKEAEEMVSDLKEFAPGRKMDKK